MIKEENPDIIKYFVNVGIEIPACANIRGNYKERAEIWMGPIQVSEEIHQKIINILKEAKKDV
jgi:hypothetical protein